MSRKLQFPAVVALMAQFAIATIHAQTISLDGDWKFAIDTSGSYSVTDLESRAQWRTALVPLSWQAQFADLRDYQGVGWYKKVITLPRVGRSHTTIIHFGAVDYIAEVFVNGRKVGKHEGGYTPFAFDIGEKITAGANEVIVRVMDPVSSGLGTEGINYKNIPHGKQSWYVQTSGLWQSVRILFKKGRYVDQVHITPDLNGGLLADVWMGGKVKPRGRDSLHLRIFDPKGSLVVDAKKSVRHFERHYLMKASVNNPQLWSLDSPALYRAELSLGRDDPVVERFGFRSIEAKAGKLLLNGVPLYLIGALDQDFYPESVYSTPSEEYLRDEMLKAKRIGLNTLRCHIKVPDPRYLKIADEVGLLIWQEIPNWDVFTPEAGQRAMATLAAMLDRDWNHPSLAIISLINESWGLDLKQADQRLWLKTAFNEAKHRATGRLVVDNSACSGNFHIKTDINDYHTYWSIPEHSRQFDQTIADFSRRPDWLFSGFGDAEQSKEEPLILSEFGNWGLPRLPDPQPWWVSRRFGSAQVAWPQDYKMRFEQFKYSETFGSYDSLANASQGSQFVALKHEIEQLRMTPDIQGYVITEFTDINWESNGLLDMWRNVKVYGSTLAEIQQQDVIIPRPEHYSYWSGDSALMHVWWSHYGSPDINDAVLSWGLKQDRLGYIDVPSPPGATASPIGTIRAGLADVRSPEKLHFDFYLQTRAGRLIAKNSCDVFVYPRIERGAKVSAEFYDPEKRLGNCKMFLGGEIDAGHNSPAIRAPLITNVMDSLVVSQLEHGAAVLCLADTSTRLPAGFPFRFVGRQSPWYDGNWASNLNWVRSEKAPFKRINLEITMGFESSSVTPSIVIDGIPSSEYSDVLAGMFVGWIHLNSAYIVQMRKGMGILLLCTLPLRENVGKDPYASTLFRELVLYLAGPDCAPSIRWSMN